MAADYNTIGSIQLGLIVHTCAFLLATCKHYRKHCFFLSTI